jgi:hypothetical protein
MNHLNLAGECCVNPGIQAEGQGAKPDFMPGPQGKSGGMVPEIPTGGNGGWDDSNGADSNGADSNGADSSGEENWFLEQVSANPVVWTLGIIGAAWVLMGRK